MVLEAGGDACVVGEDVAVVVLVPAIVDRRCEPELLRARLSGVALAAKVAADHAIGDDPAPLEPGDERLHLLVAPIGEDVVVGRAERRLRVANQQDARNRRCLAARTAPTL